MGQIANGGKLIVLTAPLTETIDHAGFFIQMGVASMPKRLEGIFNSKYPRWKEVERNQDGSARYMPAGLRTLEAALLREYPPEEIVACYPEDHPRRSPPCGRRVVWSGLSTRLVSASVSYIRRAVRFVRLGLPNPVEAG